MAYTNIDDPSAYFQTKLWTGNGSTSTGITITNDGNSDLQPDLIWNKQRTTASHGLWDSSRGISRSLTANNSNAEQYNAGKGITSFNTNGFTGVKEGWVQFNRSAESYVAWQWKANGGTTSSNTEGNVTNTLQVNQDAGFSISKFTSILSGNTTIGHGLGVTPDVFIVKIASGAGGWWINHAGLTNQSDRYVGLHDLNGEQTLSWGAAPTSTLITVAPPFIGNGTTTVMCYAFAEKQGYSKFGKYAGNGNANGAFVYCGFKPAFIWIKATTTTTPAIIFDTTRNPFNLTDKKLLSTTDVSENDAGSNSTGGASANNLDILSNGFKLRTNTIGTNGASNSYIYMAFAESPFTTSTGIPTTAR